MMKLMEMEKLGRGLVRLAACLLICGCTTGPENGDQPDSGVDPVTLTIATFNVHNFFDSVDDQYHQDDVPAPTEVKNKITDLGKALRAIEADIVALQEVENIDLLERLNTEELSSLGYSEVRMIEGNDIRGIDVALLSRLAVTDVRTHKNETFKGVDGDTRTYGFSRDCLEVTLEPLPGRSLTLLVNHLRATDDPVEGVPRRQAQAQRVREIADDIFKQRPDGLLAVIGDLNDTPASRTLQLLTQGDPPLFDLLTLVPIDQRYTTSWSSPKQVDYILPSPALKEDLVQGSVKADHSSVFSYASDHFPVIATFTID